METASLPQWSVNAFVLAGGQSTRMGRDKALLKIGGRPMVLHAIDSLRRLGLSPRLCGSRPDLAQFAPVLPDNFPGCGPLAGIESALTASDTDLNLFIPIDTPNLPPHFLRWMIARAAISQTVGTIPLFADRPQPLCAIYSRRLLGGLRVALQSGHCKIMLAVQEAAGSLGEPIDSFSVELVAAAVAAGQWPATPPLRLWFCNLNTPADLELALESASHPASGANSRDPIL